MSEGCSGCVTRPSRGWRDAAAGESAKNQDCQIDDRGSGLEMLHTCLLQAVLRGPAKLRGIHSLSTRSEWSQSRQRRVPRRYVPRRVLKLRRAFGCDEPVDSLKARALHY